MEEGAHPLHQTKGSLNEMQIAQISRGNSVFGRQIPAAGTVGRSFLDEARKLTSQLSAEKDDDRLRTVYERLTLTAQDVLSRLNAGNTITRDEWTGLCRELKDVGAISQADFDCTRADYHLVPLGYHDAAGNEVIYDSNPVMSEKLKLVAKLLNREPDTPLEKLRERLAGDSWSGDPLEYLDAWIDMLDAWIDQLAKERDENGSLKYTDFSPITDQISSCQTVSALIQKLGKL